MTYWLSIKWLANHWPCMDDLEDQYCNRNCTGCACASSLARRFSCEKNLRNLNPIFLLV